VRPFSWVLAPTWGVDAIREAATGGGPWPEIALALGLGAVYLAIGVAVLETVLTGARRSGTVALA
jgi:ABC-2 type transport system permease protein